MRSTAFRRFYRADWAWRLLCLEAALYLTIASILVKCVPFRYWKRFLGTMQQCSQGAPCSGLASGGDGQLANVGKAIDMSARVLPWQSVCLPKAVAAKWMLTRRGYPVTVYFGSKRSTEPGQPPDFHAWSVVHGVGITGVPEAEHFEPMVRYFSHKSPNGS